MAKVQGTYASLVRGVSQQAPDRRLEGQHGEQINLISDPVRGLVRRNGSILRDAVYTPATTDISAAAADSFSYRTLPFIKDGRSYDLLYRTRATTVGPNHLPPVICYDKNPGTHSFLTLVTDPADTALDEFIDGGFSAAVALGDFILLAGNAVQPLMLPSSTWADNTNYRRATFWVRQGAYSRTYTVKARRASTGTIFTASYTTMPAAFPGVLDTASILVSLPDRGASTSATVTSVETFAQGSPYSMDLSIAVSGNLGGTTGGTYNIPGNATYRIYQETSGVVDPNTYADLSLVDYFGMEASGTVLRTVTAGVPGVAWSTNGTTVLARLYPHVTNPNYQKELNDLTYEFNVAVNEHSIAAAADIVPSNIATQLESALSAAGFTGWITVRSQVFNSDCDLLEVNDAGGGDFIVGLNHTTRAADEVTPLNVDGTIIKVQPSGTDEGKDYYLIARAKNEGNPETYEEVVWREAAGVSQVPVKVFALGAVVGSNFYLASNRNTLNTLSGGFAFPPEYTESPAGDLESNPPPHFYTQPITGLFLAQDRLGIMSGNTVNLSRVGDYFNFYRTTVLTLPDDDPIEGYAIGSDSDVLRKAVGYDKNILLFSDSGVYNINTRQTLTPSTFNLALQLEVQNVGIAQPVGSGPYVNVLKEDTQLASSRLLQIQAGVFQDSPALRDVSEQIRDYVNGTPAEMVALTNPSMTFVRTEFFLKTSGAFPRARPWGLYVYQYLDQSDGQRVVDAWSAWEWSSVLGTPIGMSATVAGDGIMLYTVTWGQNEAGQNTRGILAQSFSARPDPTGLPYLDAMQPGNTAEVSGLWTPQASATVQLAVATSYGAAYSFDPVLSAADADRFNFTQHPHYTVGDRPPEEIDPLRWSGVYGWFSDAVAEFGSAKQDNLWTGLSFPAFVDLTNPYVRDRDGQAYTIGTLTIGKLEVTTTRSVGFAAQFVDYSGNRSVQDFRTEYSRLKYDTTVWVGRNTKDVTIRFTGVDWLPLTISAVNWQGQWFASRSGKV